MHPLRPLAFGLCALAAGCLSNDNVGGTNAGWVIGRGLIR